MTIIPQMNINKLVLSSRMHFKSALTFACGNALYVGGNEYNAVDTKWIWAYFMCVYENYMYEDAKNEYVERKFYGIKYTQQERANNFINSFLHLSIVNLIQNYYV